jgi:eukaryotic-like serine/threonine-protein kinase
VRAIRTWGTDSPLWVPMIRRLLAELRRRRVLNVAAAYTVGAFGLLQGADLALPRLGVPDWTITALLIALLAGFPLVCLLSWFYDLGPGGLSRTPALAAGDAAGAASGARGPAVAAVLAGLAAMVLLGAGGWALVGAGRGAPAPVPLRSDWLAMAPFRVSGDAGFGYLEEGMLDLLAAKLTGEAGLRAVEPRALLAAWRERPEEREHDARDVARSLGAGRVLLGSVVATGPGMVLAARILDTETGGVLASFEARGEASALPELVDRFAGGLLAQLAGVEPERLRTLEETPFLALRAYLEGQRLLRAGRFREAKGAFAEAQQIDSTFALPGVFHGIAASFTAQWSTAGAELAWRHRHRLAPRDQLLLEAFLGPGYPEWTTSAEKARFLERLTDTSPDRAEAWYLRGDHAYHSELDSPLPERLSRAAGFFAAATALDDRFGPSDIHLLEIAILRGDTAAARGHATSFLAFESDGDLAAYARWQLERLDGRPARSYTGAEPFVMMEMFAGTMAAQLGSGLDASDATVEWGVRRASQADYFILSEAPLYMLNRGRPARAAAIAADRRLGPEHAGPAAAILRALYWETGEALAGLESQAAELAAAAAAHREIAGHDWREAACAAGQYYASRGRGADAAALAQLLTERGSATPAERYARGCRALLEVLLAAGEPALATAAADLDAQLAAGTLTDPWLRDAASLVLAAGYERLGQLERALDATRRRTVGIPLARFLSTQLRTEARLAARLGLHDEAVRAYRHYLLLRENAEPEVAPVVAEVRAELDRLLRDG